MYGLHIFGASLRSRSALNQTSGGTWQILSKAPATIEFCVDSSLGWSQGYRLTISEERIILVGHDPAGTDCECR